MTTYLVAHWPREPRPRAMEPCFYHEARESARLWALVVAHSRAHALRLLREGCEAVMGVDGRLERCGIVREGRRR